MYDFTNLSDVEFERLSADILSRKLGVKLRYFAPGRDGGIDLSDDPAQKNIVVQVKHYAKSSFSSLISSLKKEVSKVKELKPKQYYICVSQELPAAKIVEIYGLFKEYMRDTSNIITRSELVDFLNEGGNQDILRKNFKLWLLSDKLLKDIFNNQIFIDSEVLLDDINEDFNYFVQTKVFNEALEILRNHRVLLLYGAPGVGKSINSKMLAAAFVKENYIIRYTTDGQVSNIKSVISEDPDVKEVILLDDFLGQYYFNLKSGQDSELISLIKYIKLHKNKILILNTRVTILNEAKRARFEFKNFLDQNKIPIKTINMEDILIREKAEIFYNHLLKNQILKPYYVALRKDKKYKHIINHKNYNPRIIEFVTQKHRYNNMEPEDYFDYILKNLNNPRQVWADEFDERLDEVDRIFMHTLFSLTDTYTDIDVLQECFIFRLEKEGRAQTTRDYFSIVKSRLTKSLIKILDVNGVQKVGVLNPSINDYMNSHFQTNIIGLNAIKNSILYIEQLDKMYEPVEVAALLNKQLKSGEYLTLKSLDNKTYDYLYYGVAINIILKEEYKPIIKNNFHKLNERLRFFKTTIGKTEIVLKFLEEKDLFEFYDIEESLIDEDFISDLIYKLDSNGISQILSAILEGGISTQELTDRIYEELLDGLNEHLDTIDIVEYIDEIDGYEEFYDLLPFEENKGKVDEAINVLCSDIKNELKESSLDNIYPLIGTNYYESLKEKIKEMLEICITERNISDALESFFSDGPHFEPDDYYDEDRVGIDSGIFDDVDIIFDREINEDY